MIKKACGSLLREQPILSLCEFHGRGAFFVVVSDVIDPSAYGIASHQPSIGRLQQIGRRSGWCGTFTGLTGNAANFSGIGFTHLRPLRRNPFGPLGLSANFR
jgi:hypothetical protein